MEPYLGTKLVIIVAFAFWLISSTSVYLFYLVVLHLGYDFTNNAHQLWQLRYLGLSITSASLLVSFLVAWLLSRWLGYPLAKLQEAVEKVQAGEFNTFIEIQRQGRLGFLVEAFNSMVTVIRKQADDLIAKEFISTDLDVPITKKLAELQGDQLQFSSTVEKDSQFAFTLPIAQNVPQANLASLPHLAQTKIATTVGASTASTGKFTILVVDDDKISLQVLTKLLTLQNYEVVQATTGIQTLEQMEQGLEPDLIILDIMMPRMNGYEVCQKIRESFSANQLPIIMLTAKDQPSDLVEGLSYGANDYLVKPINRSELVARVKTHIQLAKVNTAYGRFVPNEFIQLLGHESILDVKLGDHVKKEMAILFSDIRSFTTLSEQMSPEENFAFINSYLKMVVPAIRNHNGFIDKYIGDAVMAVFPNQAEDSLRAAIAMQKQVLRYNCDRLANGEVPIAIGIGIHVGSLMLGTVGEEQRMEETVISDAVNVASRLEGLTKIFGSTVIFSEKILIELEDPTQYRYRFLGKVPVKGRKDAISVFEAFGGEAPDIIELKLKTRIDFELGISFYYDRKFTEGSKMFERVLRKNSVDKAALLYLERCQKFRK
ncbi:MAG: response regulator [Symploca sp. SIO2E6]|nr:response regulator [Symploca sp. SIO2E6]